ncbi:MAG: hypothetical protein LUE20_07070 [Oscillospiraceae bacterium]|nr:hypothetical protein [Oscillospiraceae bacterium]
MKNIFSKKEKKGATGSRSWKKNAPHNKSARGSQSRTNSEFRENPKPDEDLTITVLVEGMLERMEQKGLNKFLLSDFKCTVLFKPEDLYNPETANEKLSLILLEIEKYLELYPIPLRIEPIAEEKKEETRGYYRHKGSERYVMVSGLNHSDPEQLIATLCYACTGYFMDNHSLGWSDSDMNKKRADVMAILLGFGNYLAMAYQERQTQERRGNIVTTTTHKLGCLSTVECWQVMEQRARWQEEQKKKEEEQKHKEQIEQMRRELEANLYQARAIYTAIKSIDLNSIDNKAVYESPGFQTALLEYESTDTEAVLEMCERELYGMPDELRIQNAANKLSELTTELDRWLKAFKYFSSL